MNELSAQGKKYIEVRKKVLFMAESKASRDDFVKVFATNLLNNRGWRGSL